MGIQAKVFAAVAAALVVLAVGAGAWRWAQAAGDEEESQSAAVVALATDRAELVTTRADALAEPAVDAVRAPVPSTSPVSEVPPRLRILEFDGTPNANQKVAILSAPGTEPLQTDGDGLVELTSTGTLELRIGRAAALPYRTTVEIAGGEQTLELPEGAVLEGQVVVDGGIPRRPLELHVFYYGDEATGLVVPVPTDGAGRFRLHGLVADEAYTIGVPAGYARAGLREYSSVDSGVLFELARPERGLVLEVERFPSITGRLVDADRVSPVPGTVECTVVRRDGTGYASGARAGEDGRFELFVEEPWRHVDLEYWGNPGERGKSSASFAIESAPDGDLGDLVLARGRDLVLRVRDVDGRPIPGARTDLETEPTDASGETRIVGTTDDSVRVAARGHRMERVSLTGAGDVVEVELARAAELLVELRARGEEPVGNTSVELRGEKGSGSLFEDDSGPASFLSADREGQMFSWGGREFRARGATDERGLVRFDVLRSGRPIELRVIARDAVDRPDGAVVHEQSLAPLAIEEARRIVIDLDERLVTVRGRVLDTQGRPVAGAELDAPGRSWKAVSTDREGRFAFTVLDVPHWWVDASKEGYRHRTLDLAPIPEDEIEMVLDAARPLDVRVIDVNGRALRGAQLSLQPVSREVVREVGPGHFVFADLADGPHELELRIGGARYRRSVVDEREVTMTVPAMGAVEVSWSLPPAEASDWLTVELTTDVEEREPPHATFHGTPQGNERFDPVLPGEYELVLKTSDDNGEVERARRTVVVRAGETTRVEL